MAAAVIAAGCSSQGPDASGIFEFATTNIASECNGRIMAQYVSEGEKVTSGQELFLIDTIQYSVQKNTLLAQRKAAQTQQTDSDIQTAVLRDRLATLESEYGRAHRLVEKGALPRKQADDIQTEITITRSQLSAAEDKIRMSNDAVMQNIAALDAQIDGLNRMIDKCHIKSPIDGDVTGLYVRTGEIAVAGRTMLRISDTDKAELKAYFTSGQLQNVKVGDKVQVVASYGQNQTRTYEGTVTWISSEHEFSPKYIPTAEERTNLVYASKISVGNDGYIKAGINGEVYLKK